MKETPLPVAVGQVIDGKYRVERVIGSGGMGVVVAAEHVRLGKIVALKFLLKQACENREAVSRFLREGQTLARITSAHVAHVMDVGMLEQGEPYLVMEYLEGSDFGAVLKRRGPLPIAEAVAFVLQACDAIAEAHANGIIHRDLKPSNLFLTRAADGVPLVKVLDFGISKALTQQNEEKLATAGAAQTTAAVANDTNTGALVGSPLYMSPEQIRNARRVDERSDIWSLGVILHELVCGKPPFEGETLVATLAAVAADTPRSMSEARSDVPPALEAVVLRCLEKRPEKRYSSIAALAQALQPFAPPEARGAVERISRLLGQAGRRSEAVEAISNDSGEEPGPTVPSWEGDTAQMSSTVSPWLKRRGPLLIGASVLSIAVISLLLWYARATSAPVPALAGSETPGAVTNAAHAAPPAPSIVSTPNVVQPAPAAASAAVQAELRVPAALERRNAETKPGAQRPGTKPTGSVRAPRVTPAPGQENDGTADRK
ncbi:MAG TPA: serine/threonine-protein kinase [Polyangiaceae bacterium]